MEQTHYRRVPDREREGDAVNAGLFVEEASGRIVDGRCDAIARRIVVAEGGENALEDYFRFYNDGKWAYSVVGRIVEELVAMEGDISGCSEHLPKLEECVGYLKGIKVAEMNIDSCVQELNKKVKEIKDRHSEWEKADESVRGNLSEEYKKVVGALKDYVRAFLESCKNVVRNHYVEDEGNVRNLLDVIHSVGNEIINNGAGQEAK